MLGDLEIYQDPYSGDKGARYRSLERLGEGTFGEVRRAVDTLSGKHVAIKYVRILSKKSGLPKAIFRELESLKQLSESPYVIKLFDVYTNESNLCLVTEYVESDLAEVIEQSSSLLSRPNLKALFRMILQGIDYCHSKGIMHRDIKPANLLLSSQGVVKLADFGLARIFDSNSAASMSHQVATRQYRAPELLFASRHYTPAVDLWSAAVVMAELASLLALFPGSNDIDQMYKVFQVMGSPTAEAWPGAESLPDFSKVSFSNMQPLDLSIVLPQVHPADLAFIKRSLTLDPSKRPSAREALSDHYFRTHPAPAVPCTVRVPTRKGGKGARRAKIESVEDFMTHVVHTAFPPRQPPQSESQSQSESESCAKL